MYKSDTNYRNIIAPHSEFHTVSVAREKDFGLVNGTLATCINQYLLWKREMVKVFQ